MAMSKYGYSQPLKCRSHITSIKLHSLTRLLNQARAGGRHTPGFLKLFLCGHLYVCVFVYVCVSTPEAINN